MTTKKDPTRVVTGVCRSSFMFVNQLEADDNGNKKCRTQIIIKKSDKATIAKLDKAINAASMKKFGKKAAKNSRSFGYPLRDADKEIKDGTFEPADPKVYKNCYFMNTTAYKLPGLVDQDNELIEDPDERAEMAVSGFYFRFSVTMKGYDKDGNKGVRAELNNMMFIKEGERLDGGVAADSEDWGDSGDQDPDDENDSDNDYSPEKIKELCAELKEEDAEALDEILEEFDCKNARAASKLDDDERAEIGEALEDALD